MSNGGYLPIENHGVIGDLHTVALVGTDGTIDFMSYPHFGSSTIFASLLEKLRAIPDGDGNLLEHSMVLYGSAMSDGNQHNHAPLPIILAGGASGRLKGGRHIRNPKDTTMSNLLLAILDKLEIHTEKFGDSTAMLEI